jgi:hypothetical protein
MNARKIAAGLMMMVLSGCATTAKYEAKVQSWENRDSQALVKAWGQPDSIEKLSSGNRMFVYSRLRHAAVPYGTQRSLASAGNAKTPFNGTEIYQRCATYFEVNSSNKIVSTQFRGDECKSRN